MFDFYQQLYQLEFTFQPKHTKTTVQFIFQAQYNDSIILLLSAIYSIIIKY